MIVSPSTGSKEPRGCRVVLRLFITFTVFVFGFLGWTPYLPADDTQPNPAQTIESPQISVLEGKSFAGELGLLGKPALSTDLLVFRDGMFISKECERKCGYTDGPYWVRFVGDGVQVKAETPCLKADATIVWNGTVRGDEIEGIFTWTSRRWYWTIEKEFWFNGKLVEPDGSVASRLRHRYRLSFRDR